MNERLPISDDDVRAVVRLLGRISGMTEPLVDRRRALVGDLCRMIDADVWLWAHSGGWNSGTPFLLSLIDGGWASDPERTRLLHADTQPEWLEAYVPHLDRTRPSTFVFDAAHPGWNNGVVFDKVASPTGFAHFLFSWRPLDGGVFSGIALHRRQGRPPYTPRETALAHLVLGQVDWLHEHAPPPATQETGLSRLTPREREVLIHLLGGDGKQQIAAKLALSVHTVGDYMKAIYKRLSVTTRGELMAKFLPGTPNGPTP